MTDIKPCTQEKCSFKRGSPFAHNCPRCSDCGCAPHMIDEDCDNCWNCKSDEGFIRSGIPDGTEKKEEAEAELEKEMEVER